ncbi:MAG: hypothetical protein AAFS10_23450, partial [Myxococcota bacterium]
MQFRLRQGAHIVGYSRPSAEGTLLYSTQGRRWSETPIAHDARDHTIELHDQQGDSIYWGDVLAIKARALGGARLNAIVIDSTRLFIIERGTIERIHQSGAVRFKASEVRIRGQAWDDPDWAQMLEQAQHLQPPESGLTWGNRLSLAAVQSLGLAATMALQLLLTGGVGPLLTTAGIVLATGVWYARRSHRVRWLTRPRLLRLGASSFGLLGLAASAAYFACLTLFPETMGTVTQNPELASAVIG